jgi:hypothetical protein
MGIVNPILFFELLLMILMLGVEVGENYRQLLLLLLSLMKHHYDQLLNSLLLNLMDRSYSALMIDDIVVDMFDQDFLDVDDDEPN